MKNSKIILPDLESLKADIREYLDNDMVNTVLILSDEVYSAACNDEEFMDSLMGADTLLASNTLMVRDIMKKNNGITVEVEGKEEDYSNFEYNSFDEVVAIFKELNATVYLLTQDEKEMEKCRILLKMDAPEINSWERCCEDIENSSDTILNEINGIAPDVLICSFDSPFQEKWIMANKDKMNTKMVLGIGPGVSKAKKNKPSARDYIRNLFKKKKS